LKTPVLGETSNDPPSSSPPSPPSHMRFETPASLPESNGEHDLEYNQGQDTGKAKREGALDAFSHFGLPPRPPSRARAFEQLYISHFIGSFGNPRQNPPYWLYKLPELLVPAVSGPVKDSIRATAMLFYGILTRSIPVQTEANRFYIKALHDLRSRLQNEIEETGVQKTGTSTALATNSMLGCAPIMMCHFEIMASSSPNGWVNHIMAAAKMIEIRGPEGCRLGLDHQLFLTVRLFTVRRPLSYGLLVSQSPLGEATLIANIFLEIAIRLYHHKQAAPLYVGGLDKCSL
jgi:hypothetical protein